MVFVASYGLAGEGSRLSPPPVLTESPQPTATLRPARISAVAGEEATEVEPTSPKSSPKAAKSPQKPRSAVREETLAAPKEVVVARPRTQKPAATSSRRTATPAAAESSDNSKPGITFRPVEVMPLRPNADQRKRSAPESQSDGFLTAKKDSESEVQYPIIISEPLTNESSTAEYEEEYAPAVSTDAAENLAPIVSAADMPRPGRVRNTAASEVHTPPDLSLPPIQPKPAAPEIRQDKKQSRTLSSVLRLPEFRSRPARRTEE